MDNLNVSGVYKVLCLVNGKFYIGSSKNVEFRWTSHKEPSTWKQHPNNLMYKDMQKYGVDKFRFQILVPVMPEYLKQVEQELIEMLKPSYNNRNAKGWDVERCKEDNRKARKKYQQSEKGKETMKKYQSQLCSYNGETLTLDALRCRFRRAGIPHPTLEAKKYLITTQM